ncbi:hypothetical protein VNO80_03758 [Phaseolus coccineus]|uniref:Uncharacterized protein n=1 Tax=Phaseolus coccineus TaxID=3886 RepID=A0AAN9RNA3_PHACN
MEAVGLICKWKGKYSLKSLEAVDVRGSRSLYLTVQNLMWKVLDSGGKKIKKHNILVGSNSFTYACNTLLFWEVCIRDIENQVENPKSRCLFKIPYGPSKLGGKEATIKPLWDDQHCKCHK